MSEGELKKMGFRLDGRWWVYQSMIPFVALYIPARIVGKVESGLVRRLLSEKKREATARASVLNREY